MNPTRFFNAIADGASLAPSGVLVPLMGLAAYAATSPIVASAPTTTGKVLGVVAAFAGATLMKAAHIRQNRAHGLN